MRKVIDEQLTFGQTDISQIKFDLKSRDDIPKLLKGLQYIYTQKETREKIFQILETQIAPKANNSNGRPGMDLWKILVMGMLRLNLNWDYDRLHEMVNNHMVIRQMLGHGFFDERNTYNLQTLKDNIKLLTPKILNEINQVVVECGHKLCKKKNQNKLRGRCDSFVLETNVHFPTDVNLLFDAMRKAISLIAKISQSEKIPGWRQSNHNIKQLKNQIFKLQKLKHSTSKNLVRVEEKKQDVINAYVTYTNTAKGLIEKIKQTETKAHLLNYELQDKLNEFVNYAENQIELIIRRVVHGEKIPHEEKVFSIFQPHTEWISKGKAGVPVELGIRVAILEDNLGFILNQQVMQKQTDDKIAVSFVKETKELFPHLNSCSFDKGFYTPENLNELEKILDIVALPKKGKLSKKDKEKQKSEEYKKAQKKHSAVESAINALEVHGLDKCPDHGIEGFEKYVSLAVLARNTQVIGAKLITKEQLALKRKREREQIKQEKQKQAA